MQYPLNVSNSQIRLIIIMFCTSYRTLKCPHIPLLWSKMKFDKDIIKSCQTKTKSDKYKHYHGANFTHQRPSSSHYHKLTVLARVFCLPPSATTGGQITYSCFTTQNTQISVLFVFTHINHINNEVIVRWSNDNWI